jgi:hypothetical protein
MKKMTFEVPYEFIVALLALQACEGWEAALIKVFAASVVYNLYGAWVCR